MTQLESYRIYDAINNLRLAALEIEDQEVASDAALALGKELYDSETRAMIDLEKAPRIYRYSSYAGQSEDLDAAANYVKAICLSLNEGTAEGHISVGGRRVYAA